MLTADKLAFEASLDDGKEITVFKMCSTSVGPTIR